MLGSLLLPSLSLHPSPPGTKISCSPSECVLPWAIQAFVGLRGPPPPPPPPLLGSKGGRGRAYPWLVGERRGVWGEGRRGDGEQRDKRMKHAYGSVKMKQYVCVGDLQPEYILNVMFMMFLNKLHNIVCFVWINTKSTKTTRERQKTCRLIFLFVICPNL